MNKFNIEENHINSRLDVFLTDKLGKTRSQVKKDILRGHVLVNEKPAKVHQFLRLNDVIEINKKTKEPASAGSYGEQAKEEKNAKTNLLKKIKNVFNKKPNHLQPTIISKTDDYIIIDKPAGLLTHATKSSTEPTLVDWLVKKFPEIEKICDSESLKRDDLTFRPGIVHRLDKAVSGVMLICRNQNAYDYFKSEFKQRKIKKEYLALVHGTPAHDHGFIEFEINRKAGSGLMVAHPKNSGKGRPSNTEYLIEKKFLKTTLVKVIPQTGRTNQIRVHFFALEHPIVGDEMYKMKKFKLKTKVKRLMLHALRLAFVDLNGQEQTYESTPPAAFEETINALK
jgi:23S rRNA pseudouridine1911/1915/1917 synthase